MRVIVTRPLKSARRTAIKLAALGHEALLLPLTQAEHWTDVGLAALARPHRAIVFTSAEAIRALAGIDLARHAETPVFTVGEASGEAAHKAGFRRVTAGSGTGEDLAKRIVGTGLDPLLYLAGTPRSPGFEDELQRQGVRCHVAECYAMVPRPWTTAEIALLEPTPDGLLLYSREAARLFFTHPAVRARRQGLAGLRVYCLSRAIADAIPDDFTVERVISPAPSEAELLALLS
ncbi:uroporphyrinogen-III synthase [Rhizobium sp. SGZ-381]|uniref:uroporphyrinogen-III synthase n=1 Tax=Rhizobium sp. SGZ-381 TaxID=3342800 RepID=UPI003672408C